MIWANPYSIPVPMLTSVHKATNSSPHVKPKPQRMDTKAVRIRLIEKGWNMMELAKRAKLARPYVSQIVHGRIYRPRAQARIEKVLGMGTRTGRVEGLKRSKVEKGEE